MHPKILGKGIKVDKKKEEHELIKFPFSVRKLFDEMTRRHQREINDYLVQIYEEMGIKERIDNQRKTGERFQLRPDFSGLDVVKPKRRKDGTEDEGQSSEAKKSDTGTGRGDS